MALVAAAAHGFACVCVQVTGQEVMQVPGSGHTSCTVEMANISSHFDVAVIDEIQVQRTAERTPAQYTLQYSTSSFTGISCRLFRVSIMVARAGHTLLGPVKVAADGHVACCVRHQQHVNQ